jgi:DNA invertase Pin-like site-specific DNA recombinase
MRSELINKRHLARRAAIYIRQSSPHQVLTNQESLRLQYDLRRRALELGWREEDIEVIDADLGLSGAEPPIGKALRTSSHASRSAKLVSYCPTR